MNATESGPTPGATPLSYSCHRALAPMLWVFATIAAVELLLVHMLIAIWHPRVAIVLSLLSIASILWLARVIRSLKRFPVTIEETRIRFRVGILRELAIPFERVARLRTSWPPGFHKRRSVFNFALLNYPNIIVELREPLPGPRGRAISAVAHRLDDPEGFGRTVAARLPRFEDPLRSGDGERNPQFWFG